MRPQLALPDKGTLHQDPGQDHSDTETQPGAAADPKAGAKEGC